MAQAPAQRERNPPSKFCGSVVRFSLQPATRDPQRATRNPQRLHLFQIFSDNGADLIPVIGKNVIDDLFGGTF